MPVRWPASLQRALGGVHGPRARAWAGVAIVAALVVVTAAAIPLQGAIARAREDAARNRVLLDIAHARAAENVALARTEAAATGGDLRTAIDRVLTAHGLRHAFIDAAASDGAQRIVVEAAPFDLLVRALDALAHEDGVRVADAALAARVDPGTVRAEIAFTR